MSLAFDGPALPKFSYAMLFEAGLPVCLETGEGGGGGRVQRNNESCASRLFAHVDVPRACYFKYLIPTDIHHRIFNRRLSSSLLVSQRSILKKMLEMNFLSERELHM